MVSSKQLRSLRENTSGNWKSLYDKFDVGCSGTYSSGAIDRHWVDPRVNAATPLGLSYATSYSIVSMMQIGEIVSHVVELRDHWQEEYDIERALTISTYDFEAISCPVIIGLLDKSQEFHGGGNGHREGADLLLQHIPGGSNLCSLVNAGNLAMLRDLESTCAAALAEFHKYNISVDDLKSTNLHLDHKGKLIVLDPSSYIITRSDVDTITDELARFMIGNTWLPSPPALISKYFLLSDNQLVSSSDELERLVSDRVDYIRGVEYCGNALQLL